MGEGTGKKALSWIISIAVIAVCGAVGYKVATRGPADPTLKELLTPGGGLKAYARTSYDFMTKELDFNMVRKVITEDDWRWFQDNYKNLHEDFLNLSGGLHPMESEAIAKVSVMRRLFSYGPSRYDDELSLLFSGGASPTPAQQISSQQTPSNLDPIAQVDAAQKQMGQ